VSVYPSIVFYAVRVLTSRLTRSHFLVISAKRCVRNQLTQGPEVDLWGPHARAPCELTDRRILLTLESKGKYDTEMAGRCRG
jgi:hypothetical protein